MTTDVDFDDASDVGAIRYRLHPIDVGFDLRGEGIAVAIDHDGEPEIRVSYADRGGARRVMSGPRAAVIARLEQLGYEIKKMPPQPE